MTEFDELHSYLMAKPGTVEERPFGPDTLVFKVMGKIYALFGWPDAPLRINLKCPPALAVALRQQFPAVAPGYHMNKRHWNTVTLDGTIPDAEVRDMIDVSYDLVVAGLTRAAREELNRRFPEQVESRSNQNGARPQEP